MANAFNENGILINAAEELTEKDRKDLRSCLVPREHLKTWSQIKEAFEDKDFVEEAEKAASNQPFENMCEFIFMNYVGVSR